MRLTTPTVRTQEQAKADELLRWLAMRVRLASRLGCSMLCCGNGDPGPHHSQHRKLHSTPMARNLDWHCPRPAQHLIQHIPRPQIASHRRSRADSPRLRLLRYCHSLMGLWRPRTGKGCLYILQRRWQLGQYRSRISGRASEPNTGLARFRCCGTHV